MKGKDLLLLHRAANDFASPFLAQVNPRRVFLFDQEKLFRSEPALYFFFTLYCLANPAITFEPDKAMAAVFQREALQCAFFMFGDTTFEVVCNTYVKHTLELAMM